MKNKTVLTIIAILISLVLFVSCNDSQEKGFGSLSVVLDNSLNTKSIQPDADKRTFHHYVIYGTPESDKVQPVQQTFTALSIQIDNLASGKWTFYIEGYNADNLLIGKSTTHEITVARDTVVRESYYLDWIQGQGILKLSIKVQTSKVNTIDCVLHTEGKDDITVTLTRDNRTLGQDGLYLYDNSFYVPSGVYDGIITLRNNENKLIGFEIHQSVHIFDKQISEGYFSLEKFDNLNETISPPIPKDKTFTVERDSTIELIDEDGVNIFYSINNGQFYEYSEPIDLNKLEELSDTCVFVLTTYGEKNIDGTLICSSKEKYYYMLPHDFIIISQKSATCEENGYSEHYACKYCGYSEAEYDVYYKHHTFENGKCKYCNHSESDDFDIKNGKLIQCKLPFFDGEIIVPNDVTTIAKGAFSQCSEIKSIVIPNTVLSIEKGAFSGLSSLIQLTIPFVGTSRDESDEIHSLASLFGESSYSNTDCILFPRTSSYNYYYIPLSLEEIKITDTNSIGSCACAFLGSTVSKIILPDGLEYIGSGAFTGNKELKYINIPESVTYIGINCFGGSSIEELIIPKNVTHIEGSALPKLKSIDVDDANPFFYIDGNCLIERETKKVIFGLNDSTIPDYILCIGPNAFYKKDNIKSIIIPNSVIRIEFSAFEYCSGLTELVLPENSTIIDYQAFADCEKLEKVTIRGNISYITDDGMNGYYDLNGYFIFDNCPLLKEIEITGDVNQIPKYLFANCKSLISIKIDKKEGSIPFRPWGAPSTTTIIWNK